MTNTVRLNISVDSAGAIKGIEAVGDASGRTARKIKLDNEATGKSFSHHIGGGVSSATRSVGHLASTFTKTAALGLGAFTAIGGYAVASSVKSAVAWQNSSTQLRVALKNTGQYSAQTFKAMSDQADALSTRGGFDVESNLTALTQLTRATGSHAEALKAEALATNVARGTGKDYLAVTKAIALAEQGKTTGLSRLGIVLPKGATSQQAMAALQKKYGGSTAAYARSDSGSLSDLKNTFGLIKEDLGKAFLPLIHTLATSLARILPQISKLMGAVIGPLSKALNSILPPLIGALQTLLPPLIGVINAVLPPLLGAITAVLPTLARAITSIMPLVTSALRQILPPLVSVFKQVIPPLVSAFRMIAPPLIHAFARIVAVLAPALGRLVTALAPVFARVIAVLAPAFARLITILVPPLVRIVQALAPVIVRMINILAPVITKMIATLAPAMVKLVTALAPIIGQLAQAFVTLATPLTKALVALMPAITIFANAVSAIANLNPFGTSQRQLQAGGVHRTRQGGLTIGGRPVTEKHALGGPISGYGGGDSVHAMLEPGEYVLRKEAVQAIGVANLNSINTGGTAQGAHIPINVTIPVQVGPRVLAETNYRFMLNQHARTGAWAA